MSVNFKNIKGIRGAIYRYVQAKNRLEYAVRAISYSTKLRKLKIRNGRKFSAVVVGRNDDYMPDFAQRLYATIEWNIEHLIDEVIFIEWNPSPERELLAFGLTKKFRCLRAYVVPPEIHYRVCENEHISLLEFHAKNVGIRRASLPWIVTTNADAAFGVDTIYKILNSSLAIDDFWTAERVDIPWQVMRDRSIGLTDLLRFKKIIPYQQYGTGEFALASREMWHKVRGYDESLTRSRVDCDIIGAAQIIAHGGKSRRAGVVLHLSHPTSGTEGGSKLHHGDRLGLDRVPYNNKENWGLGDRREEIIGDRVWRLR